MRQVKSYFVGRPTQRTRTHNVIAHIVAARDLTPLFPLDLSGSSGRAGWNRLRRQCISLVYGNLFVGLSELGNKSQRTDLFKSRSRKSESGRVSPKGAMSGRKLGPSLAEEECSIFHPIIDGH